MGESISRDHGLGSDPGGWSQDRGTGRRLELRAADLQAKLRSLTGRWGVINPRSAWLGGPRLNCHVPWLPPEAPLASGRRTDFKKCLAWA